MKTKILSIAAVLILIILTNCKKTEEQIAPSLSVNPTIKNIEATAGNFNIEVISNVTCTVGCGVDWILTINPTQVTGNGTVNVTFKENTSASSRSTSIFFDGPGSEDRVVTVTQLGIQPILSVSPANLNVAADAGCETISILSNLSWKAKSNQTWCNASQDSGLGNAQINVCCDANMIQTPRTAFVTITADGAAIQTVEITQAAFAPTLMIAPSNQTVNSPSGFVQFSITSNIKWKITCEAEWCTISPDSSANNGTLTVTYGENTTSGPRVATITVSGTGVANQSVTLTQTNLIPTLSVTPSNRDVTSASGSTTFEITSNTSWTAESNQAWCTIQNTTGTGNTTLNVNFEENSSTSQRVATITLSSTGAASQTATVTQQGALPTEGLVAWYPFNGNAHDESGNGNNGTVWGALLITGRKGDVKGAYNFDGINNKITASLILGNSFTFSLWKKNTINPTNGNQFCLLSYGDNTGDAFIGIGNNYNGETGYLGATYTSTTSNINVLSNIMYPSTEWVMITLTYNGVLKIYINGSLTNSYNGNGANPFYGTNPLFILGARNGGVQYFNGYLDDIRIYNRALTEQEIQQLYNE